MSRLILGIESSCDDTSMCLLKSEGSGFKILSHISFNQDKLLKPWGGVVPEISARQHAEIIPLVLEKCLEEATQKIEDITEIAVTIGPGLIGSLLTGLQAAKTLSLLFKLPINPVHHLEAHLEAIHFTSSITPPFLGLLVSGGHTQIYHVKKWGEMILVGETLDDAAGEAFDKGGKLMGLAYPAGKIIDDNAKKGDANRFTFPISYMKDRPAKMSFSGIKTSLRYFIEKNPTTIHDQNSKDFYDLCASYQKAIIKTLEIKVKEALRLIDQTDTYPIVVGGGVACNSSLRQLFSTSFKNAAFVDPKFCTDNGAMIALSSHLKPEKNISYPQCLELDAASNFIEARQR